MGDLAAAEQPQQVGVSGEVLGLVWHQALSAPGQAPSAGFSSDPGTAGPHPLHVSVHPSMPLHVLGQGTAIACESWKLQLPGAPAKLCGWGSTNNRGKMSRAWTNLSSGTVTATAKPREFGLRVKSSPVTPEVFTALPAAGGSRAPQCTQCYIYAGFRSDWRVLSSLG